MVHHTPGLELSLTFCSRTSHLTCLSMRSRRGGAPSAPAAQPHEAVALVRHARGRPDLRRALALHQQAARLAAGRGQAAELAVLHHGLADPIDAGVVADHLVVRVHHDHLKPLVHRVLRHPIGVQHAEAPALAANPLLRDAAEVARGLVLVDALVARLPVDDALRHARLAVAALDAHAVDEVALLRLVAHLARLVRAGWPRAAVDRGEPPELPVAQAGEEAEDVRLLLAPELLEVLVGAHGCELA